MMQTPGICVLKTRNGHTVSIVYISGNAKQRRTTRRKLAREFALEAKIYQSKV